MLIALQDEHDSANPSAAVTPTKRPARLYTARGTNHITTPVYAMSLSASRMSLRALQDTLIALQDEHAKGNVVGIDIATGDPMDPTLLGIYDNYLVKKQIIQSAPIIASQLLLVDEVIRAGMNMRKGG